jgi:hypothetical protein
MSTQIKTGEREIVLLEDAHIRPVMGLDILEPLPSRNIPYAQVDPFILVHEAVVPITEEQASMDTKHPTASSTTCGTRSKAKPAPDIAPVRVARWGTLGRGPEENKQCAGARRIK